MLRNLYAGTKALGVSEWTAQNRAGQGTVARDKFFALCPLGFCHSCEHLKIDLGGCDEFVDVWIHFVLLINGVVDTAAAST